SSRRRHTRWPRDWSSDVCSSDLALACRQQTREARRGERAGERLDPQPLVQRPFGAGAVGGFGADGLLRHEDDAAELARVAEAELSSALEDEVSANVGIRRGVRGARQ